MFTVDTPRGARLVWLMTREESVAARAPGEDIAITTEAAELYQGLVLLPCYQWNRCVITPLGHPLLRVKPLTLEAIARYPVITYDFALAGDSPIKRAFEQKSIQPNVVLTAIDADVIKVYVEMGLGVGILAKMAFDPARDLGLRLIDASHLFEPSMARIGLRPNVYLRRYVYELIEMFSPHLKRAIVDATLKGEGSSYEL